MPMALILPLLADIGLSATVIAASVLAAYVFVFTVKFLRRGAK